MFRIYDLELTLLAENINKEEAIEAARQLLPDGNLIGEEDVNGRTAGFIVGSTNILGC